MKRSGRQSKLLSKRRPLARRGNAGCYRCTSSRTSGGKFGPSSDELLPRRLAQRQTYWVRRVRGRREWRLLCPPDHHVRAAAKLLLQPVHLGEQLDFSVAAHIATAERMVTTIRPMVPSVVMPSSRKRTATPFWSNSWISRTMSAVSRPSRSSFRTRITSPFSTFCCSVLRPGRAGRCRGGGDPRGCGRRPTVGAT